MNIPTGVAQLVIVLLFVLPGSVYQTCRTFLSGPSPEEREMGSKVLRAVAFSTILNGAYTATLGPWLAKRIAAEPDGLEGVVLDQPRAVGVLGLGLLVVVPTFVALTQHLATTRRRRKQGRYDRTPNAWEAAVRAAFNRPGYVRVLTPEGRWVGGYIADRSMASTFPEQPAMFIERGHYITEDGVIEEPQDGTRGLWVPCGNATVVEFLDGHLDEVQPENEGESDDGTGRSKRAAIGTGQERREVDQAGWAAAEPEATGGR